MKEKKKEKLILVSPSGKEYFIGFLSPCTDGFVLGTSQTKEEGGSHLTILGKKGTVSAHITSQKLPRERRYFLPLSLKEFAKRFQLLLDNKMVFELSQEKLSEDALYVTTEFEKWYNALIKALFQKKTTKKEIIHILNFKNLFDKLPKLVDRLKTSPKSFFELCKVKDILANNLIVAGVSESRILIIPIKRQLIGIDLAIFTDFAFMPSMNRSQLRNPLAEFYQSLEIAQYIQQEVIEKRFLENLLSKENWRAAGAELGAKLDNRSLNPA
jgi:hypothetical protein